MRPRWALPLGSAACAVGLVFCGCGSSQPTGSSPAASHEASPSTDVTDPVPSTVPRRQASLGAGEARSGLYTIPVPAGLRMAESTKHSRVFELPRTADEDTVRSWYDQHLPSGRALGSLLPCVRQERGGLIREWQPRAKDFYVNVTVNVYSEPPTLVVSKGAGGDPC
jgi:hypothetical protein